MKILMGKILLIAFLGLLLSFSLYAQDEGSKSDHNVGITVKALAMDYISQNGGQFTDFRSYHTGFEIGVMKRIKERIYLHLPFKVGVVQHESGVANENKSLLSIEARYIAYSDPIWCRCQFSFG